MLISDDFNGAVWRVTYGNQKSAADEVDGRDEAAAPSPRECEWRSRMVATFHSLIAIRLPWPEREFHHARHCLPPPSLGVLRRRARHDL